MAGLNLKSLKQWYRDSSSLTKKVLARSRYLIGRIQVHAFRWGWTLISLPALLQAAVLRKTSPSKALLKYSILAERNPWIGGCLNGKLQAALKTGNISAALSAALERDRLHAKNYGASAELLREFLASEPNWLLPKYPLTGIAEITINQALVETEIANLKRAANYAESELAVAGEQIAARASRVSMDAPTSSLNVALIANALGLKPVPFLLAESTSTELGRRRVSKLEWMLAQGLIEVAK